MFGYKCCVILQLFLQQHPVVTQAHKWQICVETSFTCQCNRDHNYEGWGRGTQGIKKKVGHQDTN